MLKVIQTLLMLALVISAGSCKESPPDSRLAANSSQSDIQTDISDAPQSWRTIWSAGVESGSADEEFAKISGGLIRADGSVLIADEGNDELRTLASGTGKPTATIGRRGRGPMEFIAPIVIRELEAERLAVLDRMNGVRIIDVSAATPRQVQTLRGSNSYNDFCVDSAGFALTGRDSVQPVAVYSAEGELEKLLGHSGISTVMEQTYTGTRGSLACLRGTHSARYAWASSRRGGGNPVTTCIIDYRAAPGCRQLDVELPRLLHVRGDKALAVWDLPFPRVELLEVNWQQVLTWAA